LKYAASASLVTYLRKKYEVPADRTHILGHDQVPNGGVMPESSAPCEDSPGACETGTSYGGAANHRDPGDWEWPLYMPRVGGTAKCNDAFPLWNCSSDHTQAVRCSGGKIEILDCNGPGMCVSKPNGQDDQCNLAAPTSDAGTANDGGGGNGKPGNPPSGPNQASDEGGAPGATTDPGNGPPSLSSPNAGGCSTAPAPRGDTPFAWLLLLAIYTWRFRERRARGMMRTSWPMPSASSPPRT
jgi:hypothetical protein